MQPKPVELSSLTHAFAALLGISGLTALGATVYFGSHGADTMTLVRSGGLGLSALTLGGYIARTGHVARAAQLILALTLLATFTSVWVRGTTSSMLPLLVAPSLVGVTLIGPRAGRAWLGASIAVLIIAILRNPGLSPSLEVALGINTCIAIVLVGGTGLAYQHRTASQQARLARSNRVLVEKEEAARVASQAKSTFLATMSHEIRTPLNAVLGLAELLGNRPLPDPDLVRVRQIQDSGSLLLDLLNDILDMGQIESGTRTVHREPTRVRALVDQVAGAFHQRAEEVGVELAVEVAPEVPDGAALDPGAVRQVLVNLLGNAVKFTEAGRIVLRTSVADDQLVFEVADTGVGIPEHARGWVFEAFRQADEGRDRAFGGSGLGLAISRRLAVLHGGTLRLSESEVGGGSTFALSIPLVSADLNDTPERDTPVQPARPLHVLVVDDDPVNRTVVQAQLTKLAHTSEVAVDGTEAIARLTGVHTPAVDVVFMDQQMPLMDGLEATRHLRAAGCTLPIIALTANAFAGDRSACLHAGMDGFLTKPVSLARLEATLHAVRHEQQQARLSPPTAHKPDTA